MEEAGAIGEDIGELGRVILWRLDQLNAHLATLVELGVEDVTVHLLYHGIFLFSVLRRTHVLFGIHSYDWIHTLILLSSLNSSFIEL